MENNIVENSIALLLEEISTCLLICILVVLGKNLFEELLFLFITEFFLAERSKVTLELFSIFFKEFHLSQDISLVHCGVKHLGKKIAGRWQNFLHSTRSASAHLSILEGFEALEEVLQIHGVLIFEGLGLDLQLDQFLGVGVDLLFFP